MLGILGGFAALAIIGIGALALFCIGLKYCVIAIREFFNWLFNK